MNTEEIKKNLWRIIVYVKPYIPFYKIMTALRANRHDIAWIRRLYEDTFPKAGSYDRSRPHQEYIIDNSFETFSGNEMSDKFVESMKLNPLEVGMFISEISGVYPLKDYVELDNSILFIRKETIG